MSDNATKIGRALRAARDAAGLTRAALAERVGCAAVTIRKWEAGERNPNPDHMMRVGDALCDALPWLDMGKVWDGDWQWVVIANAKRGA